MFVYLTRGLVNNINISNITAIILLQIKEWRWGRLLQISRGKLSQCNWLSMRAFSWMIGPNIVWALSLAYYQSSIQTNIVTRLWRFFLREFILFHFLEYLRFTIDHAILHTNGELYRSTCFYFFHSLILFFAWQTLPLRFLRHNLICQKHSKPRRHCRSARCTTHCPPTTAPLSLHSVRREVSRHRSALFYTSAMPRITGSIAYIAERFISNEQNTTP